MKLCSNCGTQNPDYYTQCPNCGTALPAAAPQPIYSGSSTGGYIPRAFQAAPVTSMGGWFGWTLLCGLLLIIGPIIMMCTADDPSAKNFAKATLIFQIIAIVLSVVLLALYISLIRSISY